MNTMMGSGDADSGKYFIFFAGYYQVAAACDLLQRYRVDSRIVKAPIKMRNGCSFALMVDAFDMEKTRYVFAREKVYVRSIAHAADPDKQL